MLGVALAGVFPSLIGLTPGRIGRARAQHVIAWQVGAAAAGGSGLSALIGLLIGLAGLTVLGPSLTVLAVLLTAPGIIALGPRRSHAGGRTGAGQRMLAPLTGPGQVDAGDSYVVGKGLPAGHYARRTVTRGPGITGREFTDSPGELLEAGVDRLSPPLDQPIQVGLNEPGRERHRDASLRPGTPEPQRPRPAAVQEPDGATVGQQQRRVPGTRVRQGRPVRPGGLILGVGGRGRVRSRLDPGTPGPGRPGHPRAPRR